MPWFIDVLSTRSPGRAGLDKARPDRGRDGIERRRPEPRAMMLLK
jgi:hypothetical protein